MAVLGQAIQPVTRIYPYVIGVTAQSTITVPTGGSGAPAAMVATAGYSVIELAWYGTGSATQTGIGINLYAVYAVGETEGQNVGPLYTYLPIWTGMTVALGALVGDTNTPDFADTDRLADNITAAGAIADFGTYLQTVTGKTIAQYNNSAGGEMSTMAIPNVMGMVGIAMSRSGGTATTIGMLVHRWT